MAATDHLSEQFEQGQLFLPWEPAAQAGENRMATDENIEFGHRMVERSQAYQATHQNSLLGRLHRHMGARNAWNRFSG